jgi:DNA-binding NtrC family response regulator
MTNTFGDILVASPSSVVRQRVRESLRSPSRRIEEAIGGAEALDHLERRPWQTLYLDRRLPDLDSEELSQTIRLRFPSIEVVLLNPDDGNVGDSASEAKGQAFPKSQVLPDSVPVTGSCVDETEEEAPLTGMVGRSAGMRTLYRMVRLAAPRPTTILITGPSGTGKELVARAVHELSPRAARPWVVVNCAAIPETLLESELFGYSRGAFTGALQSYAGRIHGAQGGTLFLDEVGEMPLSLQPKLLRFLEQKELQRLGSAEVVKVDVRVVAATNANLLALVRDGRFRADLYYRLCTFPVEIPSLREHPDDIEPLASFFVEKLAGGVPAPALSSQSLQVLRTQTWPGNVRELQNVMERALILAEGSPVIRPEHLMIREGIAGNAR